MNSIHHGWSLDEIAPEARRAAERAAEAAGMPLEIWLNQLIKYVSAMELSGKGPARARAIDETIKRAAAEQARIGAVDGADGGDDDAPMMLETEAPLPEQPTTVAAEVLEPNRFAEEHPGERDIEQAIGEWRKSGALKPLVVRPDSRKSGHYEIVSGMERWHAASRLHMRRIPVTVQQLTDEEVLRATLIQKLHTKSLPPLDEAEIYQRLMEETGLSVAALSDVIGRSPTHVATALQLLELPEPVREMINSGELSVLHARTLLGAADPEPAAREVVARRLDIYQTEQLVRASRGARTPPAARTSAVDTPSVHAAEAAPETPVAAAAAEAPGETAFEAASAAAPETPDTPAPMPAADTEGATPHMDDAASAPASAAPALKPSAPAVDTLAPQDAPPAQASEAGATDTAQAPLDMGAFITAETGKASAAPGEVDATSPMVLGTGSGDAGTLIEASPKIDRPPTVDADDSNPASDAPQEDEEKPASAALADPVVLTDDDDGDDDDGDSDDGRVNSQPVAGAPAKPEALEIPAAAASAAEAPSGEPKPDGEAASGGNSERADGPAMPAAAAGNGGSLPGHDDGGGPHEASSDDSTRMVETHLSTLLGLKVSIAERNQDDGVLSIHYNSESELTDLVSRLNRMPAGRRAE